MAMMTETMYQIIDELMHADGSTWTFRETDSLIHVVCECDENVVCTNLDPVPCEKCGAL